MRSVPMAPQNASGRRKHLSDPLEGTSDLPPPPKKARGKKPASMSSLSSSSKEDQRRHKAIEKAFLKAQAQVVPTDPGLRSKPSTANLEIASTRSARDLSPDMAAVVSSVPLSDSHQVFQTLPDPAPPSQQGPMTAPASLPSAAPAPPPPAMADSLEAIVARAIRQSLAQCLPPATIPLSPGTHQQVQSRDLEDSLSEQDQADYQFSADLASGSEADDLHDLAWSDDEGLGPDQPSFIGLFRPQVFHSLLFKAIATTPFGEPPSAASVSSLSDPATAMFVEPTVDPETIPAPKLFTDVFQHQWSFLGARPSPNGLDKHLYNSAPPLSDLLHPPTVDPPIVALTNTAHPTGPAEDSLRPEDK